MSRKIIERIAEHGDELLDVVVAQALDGDMATPKLCLERLCPPQKELPLPSIRLPEIAGPKATEALMQVVTSDSIATGALATMTAVVKAHVEAVQTADLAERIRKLEGAQG